MKNVSCRAQPGRSTSKDAVIDIPAEARARSDAVDVRPAPGPQRPLAPALFWAAATLAGLLYMLAVLCLCAYAPVHYVVLLAQRTSLVRALSAVALNELGASAARVPMHERVRHLHWQPLACASPCFAW